MKAHPDYQTIFEVIMSIPRGRVATYGQVAEMAGLPRRARLVGRALRAVPDGYDLPWHRVVNARGEISGRGSPAEEHEQRLLLEAEGVEFERGNRLSLERFRWRPDG
jgi:methylated-DNA-protein-cysteine methyltransferase-like protein